MNAALFGGICAICLGSADFMGRISSRAIGHHNALLGMLLASIVLVSLWIWGAVRLYLRLQLIHRFHDEFRNRVPVLVALLHHGIGTHRSMSGGVLTYSRYS